MKFRIKENENGKYVQVKNIFGIWRNWLIYSNCTTPLGRCYYDHSVEEIEQILKENHSKGYKVDKVLREIEIE